MPPPSNGQAMVPVEHLRPISRARSEASATEQSRAVAEVQAAVLVAQQCPRDVELSKERMRRACDEYALASRAFYRYDRGDGVVNDASIHLARELAACWGNIDYGIAELHRDDEARQSEMKAWAWDQETNTRPSTTFIVPHARDRGGRRVDLTSLRDVYENNANMGGRRVRQMIFAALPVWFIEEAKTRCRATLERGDGRPLEERITSAVERFAGLGISPERMEQRLGRPRDRWNAVDLAELTITFQSISRGERAVEDEFPPQRITVDEIAAAAPPPPGRIEWPTSLSMIYVAAKAAGIIADATPVEEGLNLVLAWAHAAGLLGQHVATVDDLGADVEVSALVMGALAAGRRLNVIDGKLEPAEDPDAVFDAPAPGAATTPDPPASTDPEPITVGQLVKAAQAAGRIDGRLSVEKGRTPLLAVAAELLGSNYGVAEDLVRDQQVAEELLAKLTPAAE